MSTTVEKAWTAHGLDCAVVRLIGRHRCGYVRVPETHPWHGKGYDDEVDTAPPFDLRELEDPAENLGVIQSFLLVARGDEGIAEYERRPEGQVSVYGGLTFAREADIAGKGWWFGFDCAHLDDSPEIWTVERTAAETERLAEQVAAIGERVDA